MERSNVLSAKLSSSRENEIKVGIDLEGWVGKGVGVFWGRRLNSILIS